MISMESNSQSKVQTWLTTARWAASGGNAQPWTVRYSEEADQLILFLSIDPSYSKHPSMMDIQGLASVMSLGCLTLTLTQVAHREGYSCESIEIQKQKSNWDSTVILHFSPSRNTDSSYTEQDILSRKTDRQKYKQEPISIELEQAIAGITKKYKSTHLFTFKEEKNRLASDLYSLENIRWQHSGLFNSMLSEISFSQNQSIDSDKIPDYQLGISRLDQAILKVLKQVPVLQFFLKLGFHQLPVKKIIKDSVTYSERICFLQGDNLSIEDCFHLGQCFQEIWLETNKNGVSFQPIGNPLIALGYWNDPSVFSFKKKQQKTLIQLTENFLSNYHIDLKKPTLGFRIGWPEAPSRKGVRKDLVAKKISLNSRSASLG